MIERSKGVESAGEVHSSVDDACESMASNSHQDASDDLARVEDLEPAELAETLCDDQVRRWLAGHRVPAETYLGRYPALLVDEEATFGLIYGEFMLRESLEEAPAPEEFLWRFPQFAARLRRQLGIHEALKGDEGDEQNPSQSLSDLPAEGDSEAEFRSRLPVVPGFEILAVLGRGATGAVYKALQVGLKRLVALKVIHTGVCDAEIVTRFRAEAEAVARFQHPSIVQIYEVGEHDGLGYLALEYAAGGNLQEKLSGTPQTPHQGARLIEALARAVDYAHQHGIVHRDLKPANVVLTSDGVPKITDFGLAKLLEQDAGQTRTGDILGTPSYMAPEQARGAINAGAPAADIYALGAILYEVLTGRPPFKGATPLSTLEQVSTQEPLPPGKFQRNTPRDLETICLKCLEKDPRRRYASALELADDLHRFLEHRPILARPSPAWERFWKWAKRRPSTAVALASVSVAIVVLCGGALYYNALLRAAVGTARSAEHAALEQRNLALKALNQLVYGVQEKLSETPATRSMRRNLLDTAISGLDEIARSAEASAPDLSRAVAHQKLGEIFREVGRADDARRQLEQARSLAEKLAASSRRDIAIKECLAKTCAGLGELNRLAGRYEESKSDCLRVVQLAESMMEADPESGDAHRRLIEADLQIGRVHGFAREFEQADAWLKQAHGLAEKWVAAEPSNRQAKDLLASCYRKLADIRKFVKDPAGARADYGKAIVLGREVLAAEPRNNQFKLHLALALNDLGGVYYRLRDFNAARAPFEEAERLFVELVAADPEDHYRRMQTVRAQSELAKLERDELRFNEAAELFRRARGHLARLKQEGRLPSGPETVTFRIQELDEEILNCEDAPVALGELAGIRSLPAPLASRLLLIRTRALTTRRQHGDVIQAVEAVCAVEPDSIHDLLAHTRILAECAQCLEDDRWAEASTPERAALRQRCDDRAIALLLKAYKLGFKDVQRLESDALLSRLRSRPSYLRLIERLKSTAQ